MRKTGFVTFALAAAIALCAVRAEAAKGAAIKVSFLTGKADVTKKGGTGKAALKQGAALAEGDTVETYDGTKIELALADGSKVRLAPGTKVTVSEGKFASKERKVGIALWVGRLWATVAKSVGAEDAFEVETRNAVAGVRGTAFTVQASADLSAVVRVYAGTVGVRKSAGGEGNAFGNRPARKQVPGPTRVDQKQWEEIIATAMKQVKITSVGEIAPAEDFEDSGEDLEWAMWNKSRDQEVVH
jgi:hypothetical protein